MIHSYIRAVHTSVLCKTCEYDFIYLCVFNILFFQKALYFSTCFGDDNSTENYF